MITATKRYLLGQVLFVILCLLLFIIFISNSNVVLDSVKSSIDLCTKTIIPSLFPFFIISELIISGNLGNLFGKAIQKPCNMILGISGLSLYPIVVGMLCGFPVGAKITMTLLDKGDICKKEAERVLCLCNNPSPTFLINIVGVSLYSNKKLGMIFFCITVLTTIILGIGCNLLFGKVYITNTSTNFFKFEIKISKVTQIIGDSIYPVLKVCAYIIFFSALIDCIKSILIYFNINEYVLATLHGILELSGGAKAISSLNNTIVSLCLLAFVVGWSGVSVHLQIMSICQNKDVNLKPYIVAKLLQGILSLIIVFIIHIINPDLINKGNNIAYIPTIYTPYIQIIKNIIATLFIITTAIYSYKNVAKRRYASYNEIRTLK